jgi:hypothetical protein
MNQQRGGDLVSVCYTSARPALIPGRVQAWLASAADAEAVEVVITVDAALAAHRDPLARLPRTRVFVNEGRPCCVDGWNLAARKARGDILVQCSDDLHPPSGWDAAIRQRLGDGDATRVLAISDGFTARRDFLPHAIMTRGYYNLFGYMFHDAYWSMWSDNELSAVAWGRRAVIDASDIRFFHDHGQIHDDVRARHESSLQTTGYSAFCFRAQNGFRPWQFTGFGEEDGDSDGIYSPNWRTRLARYWSASPRSAAGYLELHRESLRRRNERFGRQAQRPDLQVLIPATAGRRELLDLLTVELDRQGVSYLVDEREGVPVGDRRNDLVARATAPYVAFAGDDGWVSHNYGEIVGDALENNHHQLDALFFDVLATAGDGPPRASHVSVDEGNQDLPDCDIRVPNHLMVWRREVAARAPFPPAPEAWDLGWAGRVRPQVARWARSHALLYFWERPS